MVEGRERRTIDGRDYVLEFPIRRDVALINAHRADTMSNLVYRKSARNFGPVMATAAATTIAQVESVVGAGELDPEAIVTPGIFVDRVVELAPDGRSVPLPGPDSSSDVPRGETNDQARLCGVQAPQRQLLPTTAHKKPSETTRGGPRISLKTASDLLFYFVAGAGQKIALVARIGIRA